MGVTETELGNVAWKMKVNTIMIHNFTHTHITICEQHTIMPLSFISVLVLGCGQVRNNIRKSQIFITVHTVSTYTPLSWHLECSKLLQIALYAVNNKYNFVYNGSHSLQVEQVPPTSKVCASTTLLVLIVQNKKNDEGNFILAQQSYQISSKLLSTSPGEICRQI